MKNTHFDELAAKLAIRDPLKVMTVVVPNAPLVEAVTRYFALELKKPELLFGVRICPAFQLIGELRATLPNLLPIEPLDSLSLEINLWLFFRQEKLPKFKYFAADQLREGAGYAQAFSGTILELDLAGITPTLLRKITADKNKVLSQSDSDRLMDLALIWESATQPKLETQGQAIGHILNKLKESDYHVTLRNTVGMVYFLTTGFEAALPGLLYDGLCKALPGSACIPITEAASYKDGLCRIQNTENIFEEWASRENEDRATLHWLYEVLGSALGAAVTPDIAILGPANRIADVAVALTYAFNDSLFFLAHGAPALDTSEGTRISAVLEALEHNLSCETMIRVLPWLRVDEDQSKEKSKETPTTRKQWIGVINATGTQGGTIANVQGAEEWTDRLQKLCAEVAPHKEALRQLVATSKLINKNANLLEISTALFTFLENVKMPVQKTSIQASLKAAVGKFKSSPLSGRDALLTLSKLLASISISNRSLPTARVFLGTPEDAAGMPFRAVRLVGMSEGAFPSPARQDSILPDSLRAVIQAAGAKLGTSRERILRQRFSLKSLLAFEPMNFSMTSSVQDISGNQKAHSALYLDVLAELPRKGDLADEFESHIRHTREARLAAWKTKPLTRQDYITSLRELGTADKTHQPLPAVWPNLAAGGSAFDFVTALTNEQVRLDPTRLGAYDGGAAEGSKNSNSPFLRKVPGMDKEVALHPSSMGKILSCPQQFFIDSVLHWKDVDSIQERGTIQVMDRGTLIHWIAEQIYLKNSPNAIQAMTSDELSQLAAEWSEKAFSDHPFTSFIGSAESRQIQIDSVAKAALQILKIDQERKATVVTPEKELAGVLKLKDGRQIFIEGTADRIETAGKKTRVVDFKSGKGKTDTIFLPSYDIQIITYALVLIEMGVFKRSELDALEFRFPENFTHPERTHTGKELERLLVEGEKWITLIHDVIDNRFFVRTIDPANCKYCPYQTLCGDTHYEVTRAKIESSQLETGTRLLNLWDDQLEYNETKNKKKKKD